MNKALLTRREINTADHKDLPSSWYGPQEYFWSYKSVKDVVLFDTTSSSGDWQGYILQELNKKKYVIIFSQENNWPHRGYTAYTNETPLFSFQGDMTEEEILSVIFPD